MTQFALSGIRKFGEPVHEEITNRILGCEGDADFCGDPDIEPKNAYVLAGVRWNDDPPFRFESGHGNFGGCEPEKTIRLVTFPVCWGNVFMYGKYVSQNEGFANIKEAPLLVRSHFGDMQFLHSMSSYDGEPAEAVRAKMLMWSEFTWRIALGEFPLSMPLKEVPVVGIPELFSNKGWTIQDLFTLGNPYVRRPDGMSEFAFGSLLHMVEDSFTSSHTQRALSNGGDKCSGTKLPHPMPGKILAFYNYALQNADKHAEDDTRKIFSAHWSEAKPNVIQVGRGLNEYVARKASWEEVKPYVECIFTLDSNVLPSNAGDKYVRQ